MPAAIEMIGGQHIREPRWIESNHPQHFEFYSVSVKG